MDLGPLSISRRQYADTPDKPDLSEVGKINRSVLGGFGLFLQQFTNPDPVEKRVGMSYLRDMDDKNGYVYGQTRTRIQAVKRRGWHIQPFSDDDADQEAADFVTWAIDRMAGSFDEDIGEALEALKFGRAIHEKMWAYCEEAPYAGKVVPVALKAMQQETFTVSLDEFGNVERLLQSVKAARPVEVPVQKFIWYTFDPSPGNPYGHGLYSRVYYHDRFMREGWKFWAIFLERFGSPHLKVGVGLKPSAADIAAARKIIDEYTNESGLIIPEGVIVELMEAARGGTADYAAFEDQQREAIATVILGNTLSSSQGDVGSQALGTVHKEVQDELTDSDVEWLYAILNDRWIRELVAYNFPNVEGPPILGPEPRDDRDLAEWAGIVKTLRDAGMDIPKSWVRDTFGIPEAKLTDDGEIEDVLTAPAVRTMVPGLPNDDEGGGDDAEGDATKTAHDHGDRSAFAERIEYWRAPTQFETLEALDTIRDGMSDLEDQITTGVKPQFLSMRDDLLRQVTRAGVFDAEDYDKRLAIVRGLTLKPRIKDFDATMRRTLLVASLTGRESAIQELDAKDVTVEPDAKFAVADDVLPPPDDLLAEWNTRRAVERAEWLAMDRAAKGLSWSVATTQGAAATGIVQNALTEAITNDWTAREFRDKVITSFEGQWVGDVFGTATGPQTTARMNTIFRNASMEAINANRQRVFAVAEDPKRATDPVVAYQISVIMDDRTSQVCEPLDQKIVKAGSSVLPRPPYHHNCRTIWVPIVESEAAQMGREDLITDRPVVATRVDGQTVQAPWQPQDGFGRRN